ncbi:SLC13 family permease [Aquimarina aquimarini]|uniref:SLC13 family permease n=1 Tax=Aquimarina aquimarini TaxID=1191734 RepID=UPI000D54B61D|nr:SLC13 family permease [Aquimarina aquimarini]
MAKLSTQTNIKYPIVFLGLIIFSGMVFFIDLVPGNPGVTITAAIAILMALWWVTEAIPMGLTSLLPLILFPVFGVLSGKIVSNVYINYVIFLFLGGFFMALALEKWDVHRRIALKILSVVGGSPFKILLGFMVSSIFLSMWMSNTATAMMMLPIAFSVTTALEDTHGSNKLGKFTTAILLCVAYGCSIGGAATLVGTPPNLALVRIFEILYPSAPEISFGQWIIFTLPLTLIMFIITLVILYYLFPAQKGLQILNKSFFKDEYKKLGNISPEQKRVFALFILLVVMWIFRKTLTIGSFSIPGWSSLFPQPKYINDGTIAIFVAVLLFIIPSSDKTNKEGLITWSIVTKIPWRIILLFGGGFALAKGFIDSGLSDYIGGKLVFAGSMSDMSLLFTVTSIMTFLTEFTSNTATTEMMLPVIGGLTNQIQLNPLFLMIPITLAASMAFMFPVATPPNAIVFGTGKLKMVDMVKAGFIINTIGIIFIVLVSYYWGTVVFDIDPNILPEWANDIKIDTKH